MDSCISLVFASNHPLLKYLYYTYVGRNAHKDGPQSEIETYTEATPDQALKSSHA